jgi:hypothetical protein
MYTNFASKTVSVLLVIVLLSAWLSASGAVAAPNAHPLLGPPPTSFTYQGFIRDSGSPANGLFDFQFQLYAAPSGGSPVGSLVVTAGVTVTYGVFTVLLDFGVPITTTRYLDIAVRHTGDSAYTPLAPRQALMPAPLASQASNAERLNGQEAAFYQTHIGSACGSGYAIRQVNPDGTVICELVVGGAASWRLTGNSGTNPATDFLGTVDSQPLVLRTNDAERLRVDASGNVGIGTFTPTAKLEVNGLISTTGGVQFPDGTLQTTAYRPPTLLARGWATIVDSGGDVGEYSSITLGADGLGLISYHDYTNVDLKVLHCGNLLCNSGNTITTVDSDGLVGYDTSITLGADGLGLISYTDVSSDALMVLHCGNMLCNSGNISTVVDSIGWNTSITLGADGLGLISYHASHNGALQILHCGNVLCNSGNITTTVDSSGDVGRDSSITIGADGLGLVSYWDFYNRDLKVLHCGNTLCNSGNTVTTVDSEGDIEYSSITLGADGLGLIIYSDLTNDVLKVLHCGNALCNSGNTATIVSGASGYPASITLGTDGLVLASYYRSGLRVLHCGNTLCNGGNTILTIDSGDSLYSSIVLGADGLGLISYMSITDRDLKVFKFARLGMR